MDPDNGDVEATKLNDDYMDWLRSDQLLLGWLFLTIDRDALAHVIHCESSAEIWSTLEKQYSRQTVAKSFQLKQQLRSVKKESLSVNDYTLKIKTIGHALVAIGEPLPDKELLLAILNGLHDYETVVSLITYQMDEIDLEKAQYLLLMHEQRLVTQNVPHLTTAFDSPMSSSMSVNVASYSAQNGNGSVPKTRGGYNNRGDQFGTRGGRGRGRSNGKRIYCQLCGKLGHFVDKYYHRFDKKIYRSSSPNFRRGSSVGQNNFRDA